MGAPRMSEKEYLAYLKKRGKATMPKKAAKTPVERVGALEMSKWSAPERRYYSGVLKGVGKYEACTLRITPTDCEEHMYTADFVTEHEEVVECGGKEFRGNVRVLHEVKGSYRLGSQDAARLRWCFAAVAHPSDIFVWAKESGKGRWDIEVWYDGGRTRLKKKGVIGFKFNGRGGVLWQE